MKRLHIHVGVKDLDRSIRFYNTLFDAQPVKTKTDYAKWMLDEPSLNFAVSTRSGSEGVDHLGIQVSAGAELTQLRQRLINADLEVYDEGEAACCYARSDKSWVSDPAGIAWEAFETMEDLQLFASGETGDGKACCGPATDAATCG